ncbi:hypothetical protein [Chitinophaga rhizophila]|uniref:Uncharacterized protein n=1 Tax=Chitinophaga rhizophila TaxID=2866212 RepID=A0ABS7GIS8_9BACT|nr:hypothetical protein [Chitinophaga rhizophila]MBW8687135.1 hypothetical protein [Chitinophaga rhizophila]
MAIQTSVITFSGRLGDLIGYYRNRKACLRTRPASIRQTQATKQSAYRFGIASKNAALIRYSCYPELDVRSDSTHINRLNKALIAAGRYNLAAITGFRFNQQCSTTQFFTVQPVVSEEGVVEIPAQLFPRLKHVQAIEVKVIATRISFGLQRTIHTTADAILIDTSLPFSGATLNATAPGAGTLVVILQVRAINNGIPSMQASNNAADIIAVVPPAISTVASTTVDKQPNYYKRLPPIQPTATTTAVHPRIQQRE